MSESFPIQRALISCWDKSGLPELAKALRERNVEIVSSGGTAEFLKKAGVEVTPVEKVTGFPEILDGRVKTLHPHIHAAILARRQKKHLHQLKELGISPIDLVVVNLYPFVQNLSGAKSMTDMIELIDIGGPTMLRAAAKNHDDVAVLHHPGQYTEFMEVWKNNKFKIPREYSRSLASELFYHTSYYDSKIAMYLASQLADDDFPQQFAQFYSKRKDLRYGENPHQRAAIYDSMTDDQMRGALDVLWGKEMSYNNYVDVVAAGAIVEEFSEPAVAVVKHTNPCGAAVSEELADAFRYALSGDPVSAFGGIVASNRTLDEKTATLIVETFFECIIAPDFTESALNILKGKKNLRIIRRNRSLQNIKIELKLLPVGLLTQDADNKLYDSDKMVIVTKRKPDIQEEDDLLFAWKIVKHVKSNAIVFARGNRLLGVGAGQMSRVDSVRIAGMKAGETGHQLQGAVMASDAFFPFRDGVDEAARLGIRAIIQPGGSVRDQEVIDACNENNIAMKFTGIRHFKH